MARNPQATSWNESKYTFTEIAPGSMWVGIPLPDLADVLPVVGTDPGYTPHITLLYADFGEQTIDESKLAQIIARIADCVQWQSALSGEVVGYGRFYGNATDGDPVFAIPSIPRLDAIRAEIVSAFEGWNGDVRIEQSIGFVPHITLGYIPSGSDMPTMGIPEVPVNVTSLSIVYAGREATIAFASADYWAGPVMVEASEIGPRVFEELRFAAIPEWAPCLPKPAVYQHPTYGEVDMSEEIRDQIIANFNAGIYQTHVPVDTDHDLGSSGTAGYLRELRVNDDGSTDVRIEYTDVGKRLIEADRVKYVSPTVLSSWTDYSTDPINPTTHEHLLIGLALTSRPFFKESALRSLIAASETAGGSPQKGLPVATEIKPGEKEGKEINDQKFGEKIADLERKFTDADTARKLAEDRVTALEAAAQERTFREQLAGVSDIDARVKELAALPVELHEGYIARAQSEVTARKQFTERKPVGSDALGDGDKKSATAEAIAKAAELMKTKPELTKERAFAEVISDPDLKARIHEERAQA